MQLLAPSYIIPPLRLFAGEGDHEVVEGAEVVARDLRSPP
jgi:hypothetical protein